MKEEQLLEEIIKAIVDSPDKVKVIRTSDEMGILLTVKMDQKDAGICIGKAGSTIRAIRTILSIVGMKNKARINIKLDVPEVAPRKEGVRSPEKEDIF